MTPGDYIPASIRGRLYSCFAFIGLGLGSAQVGYSAADSGQPTWLTVALAIYAYVGVAIGYTAATHTPKAPPGEHRADD